MKNLLFLLLFACLTVTGLQAQTVFVSGTDIAVDTLTNTDTITNSLTEPTNGSWLRESFDQYLVVQAVFQNVADTATITAVVEESMDGTFWVATDTIVSGASSIGGNTLSYKHAQYISLKYVRINCRSVGSSSKARKRIWAVVSKKPW